MSLFKGFSWVEFLLSLLVTSFCGHALSATATGGESTVEDKLCRTLRREISVLVQHVYAENGYPLLLKEMLPDWAELLLHNLCGVLRNDARIPSSKNDPVGSLKETEKFRLKTFSSTKQKTTHNLEKNINEKQMNKDNGVAREIVRTRQGTSAQELMHLHNDNPVNRVKRYSLDGVYGGTKFRGMPFTRFNPSPARPHRLYRQMMNYLRQVMYPHMTTLALDNLTPKRQGRGYMRGTSNLGTMPFTNAILRGKREVNKAKEDKSAGVKRRTKRFLFGEMAEFQPMPSLFSIMMGTATDPNTGKPIEFGGDVMRNMMLNSFTSFLPPAAQPPPGKEPNELVKIMAPMWYFSNMQQAMGSRPGSRTRTASSRTYDKKQNNHGYYGDTVPGK
ncbi:hypothetical protein BsWGS_14200 [Bradybaena similaris]